MDIFIVNTCFTMSLRRKTFFCLCPFAGHCPEKFYHCKIGYAVGLDALYLVFTNAFMKLRGHFAEKTVKTCGKAREKNTKTPTKRPTIDYAAKKQGENSLIETPYVPRTPARLENHTLPKQLSRFLEKVDTSYPIIAGRYILEYLQKTNRR